MERRESRRKICGSLLHVKLPLHPRIQVSPLLYLGVALAVWVARVRPPLSLEPFYMKTSARLVIASPKAVLSEGTLGFFDPNSVFARRPTSADGLATASAKLVPTRSSTRTRPYPRSSARGLFMRIVKGTRQAGVGRAGRGRQILGIHLRHCACWKDKQFLGVDTNVELELQAVGISKHTSSRYFATVQLAVSGVFGQLRNIGAAAMLSKML